MLFKEQKPNPHPDPWGTEGILKAVLLIVIVFLIYFLFFAPKKKESEIPPAFNSAMVVFCFSNFNLKCN